MLSSIEHSADNRAPHLVPIAKDDTKIEASTSHDYQADYLFHLEKIHPMMHSRSVFHLNWYRYRGKSHLATH